MGSQDDLYFDAVVAYGPALGRLARAYEADADARSDLLQEVHLALWRSFAGFDGRCSLRTWVYRVAHNAATSHVLRSRRNKSLSLLSLDEIEAAACEPDPEQASDRRLSLERLLILIQNLKPFDRQVILLFLEGESAAAIAEVTGISPGNVATKIHRIKRILAGQFQAADTRQQTNPEGGAQ